MSVAPHVMRRGILVALILVAGVPATAPARTLTTPVAARVVVRALPRWCDGAPRMRVQVDRANLGTRVVRLPLVTTYQFAAAIAPGAHKLRVTLANRHRGHGCTRALRVRDVRLEPIAAPAPQPLAPEPVATAAPTVAAIPIPIPTPAPPAAPQPSAAALGTHPPVPSTATAPAPATTASGNPLAGRKLYVDPTAAALPGIPAAIASRPQAVWFGDFSGNVRTAVGATVSAAAAAGAVPVLVAYNIPLRDCGSYSKGGATSPDAYRAWIRAFAAGIAGRPAIVILEPDALASLNCLPAADRVTRFDLIADAVDVLAAQAGVVTYVDIGHSAWLPPDQAAGRLQRAGVAHARGFSLNVSNYNWSADENAYGRDVAARLGAGKGFVVDTSRNGQGPAPANEWCNPPGRGLGMPPTIDPGGGPDANLWIKRPGESDGPCNGGPAAGVFFPAYAAGLLQRAVG